ncbi:MAG: PEP-CTERM sorting domain-containing protein [Chromatiales bacterium]|jgi:hypothetical protein
MKKLTKVACAAAVFGAGAASAGVMPDDAAVVIDTFDGALQTTAAFGGASSVSAAAPEALGGFRDLTAVTGAGGIATAAVNSSGFGLLQAGSLNSASNIYVTWDGASVVGNNPANVNTLGLGGIDLGVKGLFLDPVVAGEFPGINPSITGTRSAEFTIWDTLGGVSTASQLLSSPNFGYFQFDSFTGNADFSSAGAIQLRLFDTAATGWSSQFEFATAVPVPAPLALMGAGLIGIGFMRRKLAG